MEKYLITLLLFTGLASAEPTEQPPPADPQPYTMYMRILCYDDPDYLFQRMQDDFGESPLLVAKEPNDSGSISVWMNRETGSLSIITVDYLTGRACLTNVGKDSAYKREFFLPKGIDL